MSELRSRKNLLIPFLLFMREAPLIAVVLASIAGVDSVKIAAGFVAGVWIPCVLSWYWNRLDFFAFARPFAMMIPIIPIQILSAYSFYEVIEYWVRYGEFLAFTPWFGLAEQVVFIALLITNLTCLKRKVTEPSTGEVEK